MSTDVRRSYPDGWELSFGTVGRAEDDTLCVPFLNERETADYWASEAHGETGSPMEVFQDASGDYCYRPAKPDAADQAWTCRECNARITDVQPETWLTVPCGRYVTHVQMVTMTYGQPSWPVALDMTPRTAKPDTEPAEEAQP